MRGWHLIPAVLIAALVIALPVAALTDTGVEHEFREALGLSTGECEPMTNLVGGQEARRKPPRSQSRSMALRADVGHVRGSGRLKQAVTATREKVSTCAEWSRWTLTDPSPNWGP